MNNQNLLTCELYFVTTTVIDWVDIFSRPSCKHIILDSLAYCQAKKGLIIYAWVLMNNHLHLIVASDPPHNLSDTIRDFKKFTGKKIMEHLVNDPTESRREWLLNRFQYAARNDKKVKEYKIWQQGYNCQLIHSYSYYKQKLTYLHENPVKAEIVNCAEHYRYSSAIDYAGEKGLLEVIVVK